MKLGSLISHVSLIVSQVVWEAFSRIEMNMQQGSRQPSWVQ